MTEITKILTAIDQGDLKASEDLLPLVYKELRKLATARLSKEPANQTLQPTILVHEAYVRLVDVEQPQEWSGRGHFFCAAAEAMRRIVVERARSRKSKKRAGVIEHNAVDELADSSLENQLDLLALDEALAKLEKQWPEKAKLVKLRYFAGLTSQQAAESLGMSLRTAERTWAYAKVWLLQAMEGNA